MFVVEDRHTSACTLENVDDPSKELVARIECLSPLVLRISSVFGNEQHAIHCEIIVSLMSFSITSLAKEAILYKDIFKVL